MKNRSRLVLLVLGPIFTLFAACHQTRETSSSSALKDGKASFVFNYPIGTSFHYRILNHQSAQGIGMQGGEHSEWDLSYTRLPDSANSLRLRVRMTGFTSTVKFPGGEWERNSKNDAAEVPPQARDLLDQVNQPFQLIFNEEGTGVKAYKETPTGTLTKIKDPVLEHLFSNLFDFYPVEPVPINDTWTRGSHLKIQNTVITFNTNYQLMGVRGDTALIKSHAVFSLLPEVVMINKGGFTSMERSIEGQQEGHLKVLLSEGRLLEATFKPEYQLLFEAVGQQVLIKMQGRSQIICLNKP